MATSESEAGKDREVDRLLDNYSEDHRHPTNQAIHWLAVPLIVWSVVAAVFVIPVPAAIGRPGLWAALAMVGAIAWYLRLSRTLAYTLTVVFIAMLASTWWLYGAIGATNLLITAIAVFISAWAIQFIGHQIEGRRPSFLTDLVYLLVGPMWLTSKALRRFGIQY